jgi:hypothetical protein
MLLRRWINASSRLLARADWRGEVVERYDEILADIVNGPLAWSNARMPVSLAWQLARTGVEELDKMLREDSSVRHHPSVSYFMADLSQAKAPIPILLYSFT